MASTQPSTSPQDDVAVQTPFREKRTQTFLEGIHRRHHPRSLQCFPHDLFYNKDLYLNLLTVHPYKYHLPRGFPSPRKNLLGILVLKRLHKQCKRVQSTCTLTIPKQLPLLWLMR